tara:strand:- start:270 stop:476 length:207 start_codon:yes stop_codon:yes gene_type:complete
MKSILNRINKKDALTLMKAIYSGGMGNMYYELKNGGELDFNITEDEHHELNELFESLADKVGVDKEVA